jgi:hypothetical protein
MKYLGMRAGDLDGKPYAKYWNPHMGALQPQSQQALLHGEYAPELGFPVEEANQLLRPGYLPLESGYTQLENGQLFIATHTYMPGVTGDMIDWWFGWHYMEDQRYKIWHPGSHVGNGAARMIGDDPDYSDREKYVGNTHYSTEYLGSSRREINITFIEPETYLDTARFGKSGISTAPTATITLRGTPLQVSTIIHLVRDTKDGCEMRVRLWIGPIRLTFLSRNHPINRLIGSRFLTRRVFGEKEARQAFVSSAMEMNHLTSFLPQLFADYH